MLKESGVFSFNVFFFGLGRYKIDLMGEKRELAGEVISVDGRWRGGWVVVAVVSVGSVLCCSCCCSCSFGHPRDLLSSPGAGCLFVVWFWCVVRRLFRLVRSPFRRSRAEYLELSASDAGACCG